MYHTLKHRLSGIYIVFAIVAMLTVSPIRLWAGIENDLGENEVKLGQEAADQLAKESKLSTNEADLAKLRAIGNKIADVANKSEYKAYYGNSRITPFKYTFNIIEDDEINAFCVPGGFVYVCRGLLDFVQSDDELAAVLAHEITHAAHHHMVYLLREQSAITTKSAWILLAGLLGGGGGDNISNLMLGTQLYTIARINNYGREAERDADNGAVHYLTKTGYNPVGMLTFLERLAQKPELVDQGIYRSHPENVERISNVRGLINELGVPIERWRTTKFAKIGVTSVEQAGAPVIQVVLNDTVILKPAPYGDMSAEQRAYEAADRLEKALQTNLMYYEVSSANGVLKIRKQAVMSVTDADAKRMGKTPTQVADEATNVVRTIIWNLALTTIH